MARPQARLVSADSHVVEDVHMWERELPSRLRDRAPLFPDPSDDRGHAFQAHGGGWNPKTRTEEAALDGVGQEILYPSWSMPLFGLEDIALQEACFRIYNDWIIDFCSAAPDQLFGVATISTYNIEHAVTELERCRDAGHVSAMIWEIPPSDLPFPSEHYEPFWDAAEQLEIPIALHHFTGEVRYPKGKRINQRDEIGGHKQRDMLTQARRVNDHLHQSASAVSDFLTSGILERHPDLQMVLVENESSWIPFLLTQYDRYFERKYIESPLTMRPSEYFDRQFHATFFNDPPLGSVLTDWGVNVCMWSNDFPHPNSTWPDSATVIERDLGHLSEGARERLTHDNAADLYKLPALSPA